MNAQLPPDEIRPEGQPDPHAAGPWTAATTGTSPSPAGAASVESAAAQAMGTEAWAPLAARLAALASAWEHELKAARRRRWIRRLAGLAVALAMLWWVAQEEQPGLQPHTALVQLDGEIAVDTEASADRLVGALRSAFEDPNAVAVVMRVNSGGGSPVQAGIVHDEILRLKALHKKRFYVVVEEVCASGAYYIAAAADEIYANKASVVGSIGVLMDGFGFDGAMRKLGVERRLMTAGRDKGMLDPYSPENPRHKAHAQAMLDQIHAQFIDVVRKGRGERLKDDPELFTGRYWNGAQAVELGLIDGLGSLDDVAREVVQNEAVVDYTTRESFSERLVHRFGMSVGQGAVRHGMQAAQLPHIR